MANAKRNTVEIISKAGGKTVWPPKKLGKRHVKAGQEWGKGEVLLMAVLATPNGDYLKEISNDFRLEDVKDSPLAATYVEISQETLAALKKDHKEIFG